MCLSCQVVFVYLLTAYGHNRSTLKRNGYVHFICKLSKTMHCQAGILNIGCYFFFLYPLCKCLEQFCKDKRSQNLAYTQCKKIKSSGIPLPKKQQQHTTHTHSSYHLHNRPSD